MARESTQSQLKSHQILMEYNPITDKTLQEESRIQSNLHQTYRREEEY